MVITGGGGGSEWNVRSTEGAYSTIGVDGRIKVVVNVRLKSHITVVT
jgi:hypothetical protein